MLGRLPNEYGSAVAQRRQVDVAQQHGHKEGEEQHGPGRRDGPKSRSPDMNLNINIFINIYIQTIYIA